MVVVVLLVSGAVSWTWSRLSIPMVCAISGCGTQAEINASLHALKALGFINSLASFVENHL